MLGLTMVDVEIFGPIILRCFQTNPVYAAAAIIIIIQSSS